MASTWSALKIELLETGQNSGTWGTATNVNLGDAVLGEVITGSATVNFPSAADVTITLIDSATSQSARNLRLNITESSTGIGYVGNLILGSGCQIEKFYLINNTGTGAKTVKNTTGTGISVPAGKATLVYNDGTNVVDGASYFTSLTLGSALPVASGGTNLTTYAVGDIIYASTTGVLSKLADVATGNALISGGVNTAPSYGKIGLTTHVSGNLPVTNLNSGTSASASTFWRGDGSWAAAGTVTSVAQSFTGGIVSVAGSPITTSGTLALTVAGTSGGIPYFSSASTWATSAALTQYGVVYGGGAGAAPVATAAGTTGQVLTATTGGAPTWVTPAAGGGSSFTAKTTNYTAVTGDNILADTSSASWTLTLPATPTTGNTVQVMDSKGTFGQYPLTVARNGSTIMSAAENMTLDVNGAATTFVYNGTTWRVI